MGHVRTEGDSHYAQQVHHHNVDRIEPWASRKPMPVQTPHASRGKVRPAGAVPRQLVVAGGFRLFAANDIDIDIAALARDS